MMNDGLIQGQPIQDLSLNNHQVSKEDRYLKYHNYIKYQLNKGIWTAQISNDEIYLAIFRLYKRKIIFCYLKNKKLIKNLKLDEQIQTIKFSNNSRYLLFGEYHGYLKCYDINNNFKIIYNERIHLKVINDILCIDDDQILSCSQDRSLIITSLKHNQLLLKIENAHIFSIIGIDLDKSNDFILSFSQGSIKLFSRWDGKLQIANYKQDGVQMIQLISKDNILVSSNYESLILWLIDYQGLQFIKLKEFNNRIFNFTSFFNNKKKVRQQLFVMIVFIYQINIQMYYNRSNIMQEKYYFKVRQLNSLNFIIVPGFDSLLILKKFKNLQI